jgi:hypothetical protein
MTELGFGSALFPFQISAFHSHFDFLSFTLEKNSQSTKAFAIFASAADSFPVQAGRLYFQFAEKAFNQSFRADFHSFGVFESIAKTVQFAFCLQSFF